MRGKNELMSAAYELEDIENKKELTRDTESFKAVWYNFYWIIEKKEKFRK